jgi:hypothetical protein
MTYNWTGDQATVAKAIKHLGLQVTVIGLDGKKVKTYGVWSEYEKADIEPPNVSQVVGETKLLIVQGTLKTPPEVGGSLQVGESIWSIDKIETIKPATVVMAYEITVSQ